MKDDIREPDLMKRIDELENSLSIALGINDKYQRENVAIRRRAEAAEADNKKLSQQVSDYIKKYENALRKAGM
jgi:cell division protein FtsB|tara:strand:+ start:663 stop:881 length:219 start_codon:yes stop_codon:yes gene_type:complete